ncbi:MAG: heavy metal transporter [Reichenbachiella sp.]|uniref:heavy metal transporter n=1 Tax=Reichenbachiella sp. TaxID=2184521 RepID=UPI0032670851
MGKIIRAKLPIEYSIGILLLIFGLSFFLAGRIFETPMPDTEAGANMYLGMFLVSSAVTVMVLILWEELLFPVQINPSETEVVFRNHRSKLRIQVLIYLSIPVIVVFLYANYDLNLYSFVPWAAVCLTAPVASKLVSGINNYNDFLRLTDNEIEYKNNEKEGILLVSNIRQIKLINDDDGILSKLGVSLTDKSQVTIDLDEMELEEFYDSIKEYLSIHYQKLLEKRMM